MDNHNQQNLDDILRDMFPDYQGGNPFPSDCIADQSVDLPDAPSLEQGWLCGTQGPANTPVSEVVLETPQIGGSNNSSNGQLQSDQPLDLSQFNDDNGLQTPAWYIVESSVFEQRMQDQYTELKENVDKIMTYQKHLLPWTVAMNESLSKLAQQVVGLSHTVSLTTRAEGEPKQETAGNDNNHGRRGHGNRGAVCIHRTVN